MKRVVVNVATGEHYLKGQERLLESLGASGTTTLTFKEMSKDCPSHADVPYAFKAFAMAQAADAGFDTILWCDACILPIRDLTPLWEKIEKEGAWISRNGYTNYEWTADSAYPDLFPSEFKLHQHMLELGQQSDFLAMVRPLNRMIPHVVATAFGVSLNHPVGVNILREYERLAKETKAFCGPWKNDATNFPENPREYACGPADVRGHRHDQSALSVLAWRNNVRLTSAPDIFAYGRADEAHDEKTILLASGEY